jgi:hypothetical protein
MECIHRIDRDGQMLPQRKKQRTLFDMIDLDVRQGKDQVVVNAFIASFDSLHFYLWHVRPRVDYLSLISVFSSIWYD